ncbi:tripartite tricarboxylate transporter substrate binding protein [Variovorax sp. J31P207]|uniref:Bug family tripartite tricarboxylate transporter substrate binding protein n=1 Tax=Variovorax sp. J31P207 TaxID=3053510 RepID=UPI002576246A|nr:tripartite tricarboxylate transporter substrate binding protein [Variovorax sp. J31P207]MDM0065346.1 tripartite tricarboxylate transporter substrate binding protein [Variovorax sp. J31P207]
MALLAHRYLAASVLTAALALAFVGGAEADTGGPSFPSKPVTILTTFSAGSGPDTMMRAVGEVLSAKWKQPVLIDNRPGGAGFIAINAAKAAAPDGHTILMHDGDAMSALPTLFKSRNFRVFDSFEPAGALYSTPFFVVVAASSPWKNVGDLLAAAKAKPDAVTYGTWGVGTTAHLQSAMLETAAGVQMLHVPYKEMGQLYTAVSTGETDWALGAMASTQSVYEGGRVKYLAIARSRRLSSLPNVPTLAEAGGPPNVEASGVVVLLTPKNTPAAINDRINRDVNAAVDSPEVQARFKTFNFEAVSWTPQELRRQLDAKAAGYQGVVARYNIKLD